MALVRTTLAAEVTPNDRQITLAAITGIVVGSLLQIGEEKMRVQSVGATAVTPLDVLRGISGTKGSLRHPSGAGVTGGNPEDFSNEVGREAKREIASYSASGAIALPTPGVGFSIAVLNGAAALAMTLADPSKAHDGDILIIVGNGKAAHTLTYTGGLGDGGATLDVGTFAAGGRLALMLIAVNEKWVLLGGSVIGGAGLANATVTFA